jgi:putative transposase
MEHKRFSEEKIISILKEHEAGASAADLGRLHGIAWYRICRWTSKCE